MNQIYIVSTGPGKESLMSIEARGILLSCDVVVGYDKYMDEVRHLLSDKTLLTSGMTQEIQRCEMAIESALSGRKTALISNGDVNVFGLATLLIEMIDTKNLWDRLDVISIPGITSMFAAASALGAPISQDFAIISLSDRLTPIETIEKHLTHALEGDFILGIYNPKSKSRTTPYALFLDLLKKLRPDGITGIVTDAGRESPSSNIVKNRDLIDTGEDNQAITMSTVLVAGNSTTRLTENHKMLTPRGYASKYPLA